MNNTLEKERKQGLHVCLISTEIFAWGKYGGFGRATRILGSELVKRGVRVSAIIPQRKGQKKIENLEGIQVYGYDIRNLSQTLRIFKDCQADIYHSQEPSFGTYFARRFHPDAKHIITFRDTRLLEDWWTEFKLPSLNKFQVLFNWFYEDNFLVHQAVRQANACYVASNLLKEKAVKKYHLKFPPNFLPTPVTISKINKKAEKPTVCYLARWDRRKRPEIMVDLARAFPQVQFIIAGSSRDKQYDEHLRQQLSQFSNVELPGFINQFDSDKINELLSQSWILINTAAREGLPNSFIEACAHECSILSEVNPDGFASNFGYSVQNSDFTTGLNSLLANDLWKALGEKGYKFVKDTFEVEKAVDQHLAIYQKLFAQ